MTPKDCRFFLGRTHGPGLGAVELVDGCHSDAEGVARAAKLIGRIFNDDGPWVMVELHPLPDLDPPINDADAELCANLVADLKARWCQ